MTDEENTCQLGAKGPWNNKIEYTLITKSVHHSLIVLIAW